MRDSKQARERVQNKKYHSYTLANVLRGGEPKPKDLESQLLHVQLQVFIRMGVYFITISFYTT